MPEQNDNGNHKTIVPSSTGEKQLPKDQCEVPEASMNDDILVQIDLDDPGSLWSEDDEFGSELHRIVRMCIINNWHRTDGSEGGWHYFTKTELDEINGRTGNRFDHGYCFLDEDGKEGMIRLNQGHCNPKWSFWMEGDRTIIDLA